MQEIFERRFRWMVRQILVTVDETKQRTKAEGKRPKDEARFVDERLEAMRAFFATLDAGISAFSNGEAFTPESFKSVHTK